MSQITNTQLLLKQAQTRASTQALKRLLTSKPAPKKISINSINPKTGWSALQEAVIYSQNNKVEELLRLRAAPDLLSKESKCALRYAVESNNEKAIHLLMSSGANSSSQSLDGKTALHVACEKNDLKLVEAITRYETHAANVRDQFGRTPLHYAAYNENLEMFNHLCEKCSADRNILDNTRKKPHQRARGKMFYDSVRRSIHSPNHSFKYSFQTESSVNESRSSVFKENPTMTSSSPPRMPKSRRISMVLKDITNQCSSEAQFRCQRLQFDEVSNSFLKQPQSFSNLISRPDVLQDSLESSLECLTVTNISIDQNNSICGPFIKRSLNTSAHVAPKVESFTVHQKVEQQNPARRQAKAKINLTLPLKTGQRRKNMFSFGVPAQKSQRSQPSQRSVQSNRCEYLNPQPLVSTPQPTQKPSMSRVQSQTRELPVRSADMPSSLEANSSKRAKKLSFNEHKTVEDVLGYEHSNLYSSLTRCSTTGYDSGTNFAVNLKPDDGSLVRIGTEGDSSYPASRIITEESESIEEMCTSNITTDPQMPTLVELYQKWKSNRTQPKTAKLRVKKNNLQSELQSILEKRSQASIATRKEPVFEGSSTSKSFSSCCSPFLSFGINKQRPSVKSHSVVYEDISQLSSQPSSRDTANKQRFSVASRSQADLSFLKIESWLKRIGLEELTPNFKDNNYMFLREFRDDFAERPADDLVRKLGIDKIGHQIWLLFKLKEDFAEVERQGLFKHVYEHPEYNLEYPKMRVWLKKNRFEDLAESFQDAGYESLEQVLMQLQFGEIKLDDTFIAKQLGVTDAERRRKVLSQLKQVYDIGARASPSRLQQGGFVAEAKGLFGDKVEDLIRKLLSKNDFDKEYLSHMYTKF